MDLDDEWGASELAYAELVFRPVVQSGYSLRDIGSKKAVKRVLTGAALNKGIFAAFTMAGALFPFFLYATHLEAISLTLAVSLSVLLVFGYIVLYCVQVLPTFVTSGSFAPLAVLPVPRRAVSVIATMTLWRTLDYILIASVISQLAATAYFTASAYATLTVLFASLSSFLLAVGLSLWLTQAFQSRLESGGMSGLRAFVRPMYFVLWGLGVMSAVFLFSLISFVAPPLQAALSAPGSFTGLLFSLVFPFSAGLLSAHFHGQSVPQISLATAVAGLAIAGAASAGASRVILRVIAGVVLPSRGLAGNASRTGFSFRVRGPLAAYVLKDIRVSSRNPATGFLFALPIFEVIAVVLPLTVASVVRVSVILVGTLVGGSFALFISFLLVTVEDLGVERRTALPFSESVRTLSKAVVSTAAYLPVPIALLFVLLGKPATFGGGFLIPVLAAFTVFVASIVEVSVIRALAEGGHGNAVRFAAGVGSGELLMLVPAIAYAFAYVLTRGRIGSLEALAAATALEVAVGVLILRGQGGRGAARSTPVPEAVPA